MSRLSLRSFILTGLCLSLVAGCQSTPPASPVTTAGGQEAPAAPAPQAPMQLATAGFTGSADINGVPFANAEVKVYRPGQTDPVATAKTDENGRFSITLGSVIAPGGANVVAPGGANVIAPGGANVIAPGGANVIAPGGANVIAPGGGNVIAPGGGNVIAPGGGNVIAPGGGNVIAPGGANLLSLGAPLKVTASKDGASLAAVAIAGVIAPGGANVIAPGGANVIAPGGANVVAPGGANYRLAQAADPDVRLTASTTLAVLALGDRLEGAMRASYRQDGTGVVPETVSTLVEAVGTFTKTLETALGTADQAALVEAVTHALDADGQGALPPAIQRQVTGAVNDFQSAFLTAAKKLGDGILRAIASGGTNPQTKETTSFDFGGVQAPAVIPPKSTGTSHGSSGPAPVAVSLSGTLTAFSTYGSGDGTGTVLPAPMDYAAFLSKDTTYENRYGAAQVTLANRTYLLGGHDLTSDTHQSSIVVCDAGVDSFSSALLTSALADIRAFAAATATTGKVYVAGGASGEDGAVGLSLDTVQVASTSALTGDSATFTLDTSHFLTTSVISPTLTNVGSRLYVIGGGHNASPDLGNVSPVTAVQTSTLDGAGLPGAWSSLTENALNYARYAHVAFVGYATQGANTGPKYLYVIGGRNATASVPTIEVAALNPTTGALVLGSDGRAFHAAKAADPVSGAPDAVALTLGAGRARYGMSVFVRDNYLYVLGGFTMSGGVSTPFPGCDRAPIDPMTGKLGAFAPYQADLVDGRGYHNVILTPTSDLYVAGGSQNIDAYDPLDLPFERSVLR